MKTVSVATRLKILFSIWIYIGWFGCVYFGKMGWQLGSLIFPVVGWILLKSSVALNRQTLAKLSFLFLMGLLFDSAAVHINLIQITPPAQFGWLPLWMISLWLLFISSLPLLQGLFHNKLFWAGLLGAIFGPLSYRAGAQFETLFLNGVTALAVYAAFWAIYIPGAVVWLGRNERRSETS